MGHTLYYHIRLKEPEKAARFIERVCKGLRWDFDTREGEIIVFPPEEKVEPLVIKDGKGFAKTYKEEPYTTIYLLLLFSLSAFGSVDISDDEDFVL
ncbi:hypothetical protein [Thermococcus alcaliphilus]|uniref:hypothetical protein n=1 Tax=Thermococcus alcaliphilus TaxID=139207 RepID=UPI0020903347|nr:hypothetical protein [Thermococcus alcaliphilus]MCO6041877.1 hypothetical protein [Thermococcus alcaliphilus]